MTFFDGAPLADFGSSPLAFLLAFADFEVEGVVRLDPEAGGFAGLLVSTGSSLGVSFSFGANTGDEKSSSWNFFPWGGGWGQKKPSVNFHNGRIKGHLQ